MGSVSACDNTSTRLHVTFVCVLYLVPVLRAQLMPFVAANQTNQTADQSEAALTAARKDQIAQLLNATRPTALVLHVGLHELCGAYGPGWSSNRLPRLHAPCASRQDLLDTYADFRDALRDAGFPPGARWSNYSGSPSGTR
jgi:hypothetical protein